MNTRHQWYSGAVLLGFLTLAVGCASPQQQEAPPAPASASAAAPVASATEPPKFEIDPTWPKLPLPNQWTFGELGGVSVDPTNHIWVAHRPWTVWGRELAAVNGEGECCRAAPSIIEFDQAGNVVQSWPELQQFKAPAGKSVGQSHPPVGKEGALLWQSKPGPYGDWGEREHTVIVDAKNNVWVANDESQVIYKFTRDGKHILTIGEKNKTNGSNDTKHLGRPAGLVVDDAANELYVSDGYTNRRVIVFDMETGAYKRHWGAYGNKPDDSKMADYSPSAPPRQQFDTAHGIALSKDGKVYLADRGNDRVQVFDKSGKFLQEGIVAPETVDVGSVYGVAISPSQNWVYVNDGSAGKIRILNRETLKEVGSFGSQGRHPGQFLSCHSMTVDQQGNIYVAESRGRRVQKFKLVSGG